MPTSAGRWRDFRDIGLCGFCVLPVFFRDACLFIGCHGNGTRPDDILCAGGWQSILSFEYVSHICMDFQRLLRVFCCVPAIAAA